MRKIWIFLVAVIVFMPSQVLAHSQTQVIEMTANGFEPPTVTVDENSAVLFVNEDKVAHWPASNVHPTHEIYPEFDPQKPINPGTSWSFKPKKAGEWKFHDHLLPHQRGTLVVLKEEGSVTLAPNFFAAVKDFFVNFYEKFKAALIRGKVVKQLEPSDFKKLKVEQQMDSLKNMVVSKGSKATWEYFRQTFLGDAGSSGNIHDLAHFTGKLIFEKAGFEGISICTQEFAFGCYHGFLDKAFEKNLDKLELAEKSCRNLGEGGPSASCIHGIGHGIASFFQTNDLKKSLLSCQRLKSGQEFCYDGVFMEFERAASPSLYSKDDPYHPCDSLEREFGSIFSFACGRNQPTVLLSRFKFSFEDLIGVCLNSKSQQFKAACIDSLGFIVVRSSSEPVYIIETCKKIGVLEYVAKCSKTAAGELIFQSVPGWQQKAPQVCHALTQDYAQGCQEYLNQLIREYGREVSSDENLYIRKQLKVCFDSGGRDSCYKQVAQVLYDQLGLSKTMQLLKENEGYPEVYARCHEVTHYLSRLEYDKQKDIAKVYTQCDSTCHGGCYHGTLEAYLKEKNLDDVALANHFPKVCGKAEDYQKPIEFNECLHGMGHAAMFVTDMELKESLKLCDTIQNAEHRERCYTGVFMENSSSSTSDDHASVYIKADDPFYPCNVLEEKYQPLCWQYQSSYFSIINKQDWVKVSQMCLQIPQKYQDKCFRTIGTNQVGFTSSLTTMKQDCDLMPTDHFKDICVAGVVSSLSYRFVGESQKMIDFCSLVDSDNKETCFKQMGTGLLDWSANKDLARQNCQKIPDSEGADWCLSVI